MSRLGKVVRERDELEDRSTDANQNFLTSLLDGKPAYVLSPMVGQSELAFRLLCRRHGVTIAVTPMLSSDLFVSSKTYRRNMFQTCKADRPLIVQFCGNDADLMLKAAQKVEKFCDGIDVNLGCPQEVARRGHYGAFLMEDWKTVTSIVRKLSANLSVPVTCKIRRFKEYTKTLAYARAIQEAGCSLLTVHPRLRDQREEVLADWDVIAKLRRDIRIPIIANGDMWHASDVRLCEVETKADGYMSAQGLLHNPALFEPLMSNANTTSMHKKRKMNDTALPNTPMINSSASGDHHSRRRRKYGPLMASSISLSFDELGMHRSTDKNVSSAVYCYTPEDVRRQFALTAEYIALCRKYPPSHFSIVRRHVFFMLFDCFQGNVDMYRVLCESNTLDELALLHHNMLARAETGKIRMPGKKDLNIPRRRDGTLAPPPWPEGGGNKGVSGVLKRK